MTPLYTPSPSTQRLRSGKDFLSNESPILKRAVGRCESRWIEFLLPPRRRIGKSQPPSGSILLIRKARKMWPPVEMFGATLFKAKIYHMIYHRSREMSDETNEEADERTKAWSPTQTHGPQKGKPTTAHTVLWVSCASSKVTRAMSWVSDLTQYSAVN